MMANGDILGGGVVFHRPHAEPGLIPLCLDCALARAEDFAGPYQVVITPKTIDELATVKKKTVS